MLITAGVAKQTRGKTDRPPLKQPRSGLNYNRYTTFNPDGLW